MKRVTVFLQKHLVKFENVIEVLYGEGMCHITWLAKDDGVEPRTVTSSFPIHSITRVDVVEG